MFFERLFKYNAPLDFQRKVLLFLTDPSVAARVFSLSPLEKIHSSSQLSKDEHALAKSTYGYRLLVHGQRYKSKFRNRAHRFFTQTYPPLAQLFAEGGWVEKHYAPLPQTFPQWLDKDRAYIEKVKNVLSDENLPLWLKECSDKFRQRFERSERVHILSALTGDGLAAYGDLLRPGLLYTFELADPHQISREKNIASFRESSFRELLLDLARNCNTWFPLLPSRSEGAGAVKMSWLDGRSGGMSIYLAQSLAAKKQPLSPFVGVSVGLTPLLKTRAIEIKTVAQKVALAREEGFRILFLPESCQEVVENLSLHKPGLFIDYLPEGIQAKEGERQIREFLGQDPNIFRLTESEIKEALEGAIRLYREERDRDKSPSARDKRRAKSILKTVEKQTEDREENIYFRQFYLASLAHQQKIASLEAKTGEAKELAEILEKKFHDFRVKNQLPSRSKILAWEVLNRSAIPMADEQNYREARDRIERLLESASEMDGYLLGQINGTLGQIYTFWGEEDPRRIDEARQALEESWNYIRENLPREEPQQINYLLKTYAVEGDVEGASQWLKLWQKKEDFVTTKDRLYYVLERLRLYLTALRGKPDLKEPVQGEKRKSLWQKVEEFKKDHRDLLTNEAKRLSFWVLGNVERYWGALECEQEGKEAGLEWLEKGILRFEKVLPGIRKGKAFPPFLPMYGALWAEVILAGQENFLQSSSRKVLKGILTKLQALPYRRRYHCFEVDRELDRDALITFTQQVHY